MPSLLTTGMRKMVIKETGYRQNESSYISLEDASELNNTKRRKSLRRKKLLCFMQCAQPAAAMPTEGSSVQIECISPAANSSEGSSSASGTPTAIRAKGALDGDIVPDGFSSVYFDEAPAVVSSKDVLIVDDQIAPDGVSSVYSDDSSFSSASSSTAGSLNKIEIAERLHLFLRQNHPSFDRAPDSRVTVEEGATTSPILKGDDGDVGLSQKYAFFCSTTPGDDSVGPRAKRQLLEDAGGWLQCRLSPGPAPEMRVRFETPLVTSVLTIPRAPMSDHPKLWYTEDELDEMVDTCD
uniref:Uncharacterized protein n=1 Tax=Odontella aurita TaxID=265563 RepID=A0A7S4MVE0_9STRA|mmetsp:Transcript_35159/g.104952  ORF Transcript_35159/g.104952 Transcript_35159/m.104952 type:complete len:295 (+) Transcript_35159:208-1092(+)